MYADHLEVEIAGAPRLNVTLEKVGLTRSHARRPGCNLLVSEDRLPTDCTSTWRLTGWAAPGAQ